MFLYIFNETGQVFKFNEVSLKTVIFRNIAPQPLASDRYFSDLDRQGVEQNNAE